MPINEIDIVQTPSGQLVTEIELQQGLPGPPNTLEIGNVTTGVQAAASITGSSPSQLLHLTLPKGNTGTAATIAVGTTTTGAAGSDALVTNAGTNSAAVFDFTIPRGNTGATGTAATIAVGATTTGEAGSSASVTNVGTNSAAVFNFDIPRGNTGATGPATQLSVASTSTGSAGSEASVTISGTAPVQSLAFTIPRGNTGATGPATQLSVASTTTGAAGSNASVTISGDAPNQSLAFTIPTGPQGPQGPTGSSGATAQLTGYVSSPGTVAATDTVIQAVGKLNGNDELKAPIASLYPYIGGKLLTYTDEEAAIADPLISAGDIYRKTAGGVDYVNPDNVPSLDLRFATDKTLTARRGPTPTFTRGSGATYIGSDGLIHGIDTSATSNSISAASKTFTLDATAGQDQLWRAGDAVEASNGSNIMTGTVTSYNATTQSLVCNMTTASGTGTFTSWRIGYRGPRFDHDSAGVCRGLLIEESRTNLILQSENFASASWVKAGGSISSVANIEPDGSANSELFSEDGTTSTHRTFQSFTGVSGTSYTLSVFLKFAGRDQIFLENRSIGTNPLAIFNIQNGTIGSVSSGLTAAIQAYPNGWYRCSITGTATLAGGNYLIGGYSGGAQIYTGLNGPAFYLYGAQVEAGSFPTSYIPTTTGTLARSADVCSITGGDFNNFYNQSEGTLTVKVEEFRRGTSYNTVVEIFNGLSYSGNRLGVVFGGLRSGVTSPVEISLFSGGPAQYQTATTSTSSGYTAAIAYATDNVRGSLNGNLLAADTPPSNVNIGANTIRFGSIGIHIAAVRFYKKRLPNAKIQALTV
jgi:hypothetical protein